LESLINEKAVNAAYQRVSVARFARVKGTQRKKMNRCFVLMPFSPDFKNQWEVAFIPAIQSVNLRPFRGDEEALGTNMIMKDITKSIYDARIIVADLTGRNSNVMYELGLAHAAKKPVIMLAQDEADIPFDLRHIRYLKYNEKDLTKLRSELAARIHSTLSQTNPQEVDFFPQLQLMSEEVTNELAYLRQKTLNIDIEVDRSTAE
jgi:nucleoside 2-deoxyribosyltransferase